MTSWRPEIKESYHNSEHYSTAYPDLPTEPGSHTVRVSVANLDLNNG